MWKGKRDPAGETKMAEMLKDPTNPIRRVYDLLFEGAKEMIRDGRMKMVDGVPIFSEEVNRMLAERKARAHARCTKDDPCGGVYNVRIKASNMGEAADKIGLLREVRRLLRDRGFDSRIKAGTLCIDRPRPASRMLLSAVAIIRDRFQLVCVEELDASGKHHRYTLKLVGPLDDELDHEHLSAREGTHRHECVDGKKQARHIPTSGDMTAAVERFLAKIRSYPEDFEAKRLGR